ncbi:MAG: discoidin domain-containing protein [Phycisphaerae bacterium]|nr:discoidin domain-containing protein [Phycisphaerae bacterium]
MKKFGLILVAVLMCSTQAMAIDIACSTQVSWWGEADATTVMENIRDRVPVSVEIFSSTQDAALADWLVAHTGNGQSDLLILSGRVPTSIYTGGNAQPDGSIAELFLDDGNCIINTGDWFFYVSNPNNAGDGLANLMDVPGISMAEPIVAVTPTEDGQLYTPSFAGFSPSRPWHLEQLDGTDWTAELIMGINADGTRADPAILVNTVTGARVGSFFQVAAALVNEKSDVISEWINNWYLLNVNPAGPARDPKPAAGDVDVLRDGVLTWTPGPYPGTHNVYFGESYEDVNSMTAPTASGLTEASFTPGRLEFEKTYFWRVDEVNASPDKTVYQGKIWSFEVEPYSIQIPIDVNNATASTSAPKNLPGLTVDGSGLVGNAHSTISETMWLSAMPDLAPWLMYEFDRLEELDKMLIWNSNSASEGFVGWGIKDVTIEYSSDGVEWTALAEPTQLDRAPGLATFDTPQAVDFGGVSAKYVKLNIQNNWGGILMQYGLSEVQFYGVPVHAREPIPASGSADVRPDAVVAWRAGREAGQHTVYVSDDANAVADGSATSISSATNSASLKPFDLAMSETYYWRVDEVNDAEATIVWAGPVWSLNTATSLIVDDFESYTNLSPDRPFQTWLDGYGYSADEYFPVDYPGNGTGAGIGHDIWSPSSPYFNGKIMETVDTIAGSGQSMPFYYDNAGGTSQTVRTFAAPQDWTVGGAKVLSIAFRGQAGNTGTLFLMINSTKVVYSDGVSPFSGIGRALWQTWNIDLTGMSGLQNVTKLTLGVEGNGSGMILFDDILLVAEPIEMIISKDVTTPGDELFGVPNDGDWPAGEYPALAIDNDETTKFLHRQGGAMPTGFQVTPSVGATVVTGLTFTTANDTPTRDPITFELSGSNTSIDGPYETIASGNIVDFAGATEWPRFTQNTTPITFNNTKSYKHYQIVFPTLRGAAETLMQIAEVELLTQ